jgi:hypothetical protein
MPEVDGAVMAQKADALAAQQGELVHLSTPSGPCVIFGAHLVHTKLIGIIGAIMNLPEWTDGSVAGPGAHSIVFRGDGVPVKQEKTVFATSHFNTLSMAINLRKHFDVALNTVITAEPTLSLRAALWHELLTSICHEIHHVAVASMITADDVWTEEEWAEEEASARQWAKDKIAELAETDLDMEPPPFNEEPFFGFLFMQANVERVQSGADEEIWDNQLKMMTENWAWHDPSDGLTCHTWKDWINVNVQEVVKDATSVEATETKLNALEVTIVNRDTGEESNVETDDANAVVPVTAAVTKSESTFKYVAGPEGDVTKVGVIEPKPHTQDEAIAIAFGAASDWPKPEEVVKPVIVNGATVVPTDQVKMQESVNAAAALGKGTPLPVVDDPELMDLIENGMDDEPFIPGHDGMAAEQAASAEAAQPLFAGSQQTVQEQPVHQPVQKQPEMTQAYDPQAVQQTTQMLFQRLFAHIFSKCAPVNGVFANPTAIFEPVPVTDIPGINILVGCDTINETGQFKKNMPVQGFVKGQIFQKSKLPAYHIYLNVGGVVHQRRLVPQNTLTGSGPAQEAAAGNNIGWIIDAAETDKNAAFKFKYANGVLTAC